MNAATISPARLVAFLENRRSYPGNPGRVRLLQTHASWVVLTGRRTYKVKKAVNFGFLDFSTLEKRRYYCEREVVLNRRLCPGVHIGVLPISITRGRLAFGPGEEVVEYAVEMHRLPERYFMLRRLARGEVSKRDLDAIVATLSPFYKAGEPGPEVTGWGRVGKLKVSTEENFRQTGDFIGTTITFPAFEAIRLYTNRFYRRHATLFAARVREKRIRDCHGDLHLEHIHLSPDRLTIYDCIEFNDRFRYIDVANDTAFLSMDFDFRGRPDFGRYFATRMAAALDDPGILRLLDFYKCYRAFVRGKVESFHASADGVPDGERVETRARAEKYFQLALRYAVCGSEPMVLIVMGRVGSGKSTLARSLARELGWPVFSSDRVRKDLAGVPLYTRGGPEERRRLYARAMTAKTYDALAHLALGEVQEGRGVVIDATFACGRQRNRFRKVLQRAGAAFCFVETCAAGSTLKRRLAARERSNAEVSDARLEDFPALDRVFESPAELKPGQYFAVRTARTSEAVVSAVLKTLAGRRINHPSP